MALIVWRVASVFTARAFPVHEVAAHALVPTVLNAPEDLSAAARVQSAGAPVQNVAAQAQNVAAVDLIAVGDHDAVVVRNAGAFPHVVQALSGKVADHSCAQVDPVVARGSRSAHGVQVARGDPSPPVAGSFPGVPALHFVQADLFFRAAPDVPKGFRFPLPAVCREQLAAVGLAANR